MLATDEQSFWELANNPTNLLEQNLLDFLRRALQADAPIYSPEDLAWHFAAYARIARQRLDEQELEPLKRVRAALETSLGVNFTGDKGEHFFKSTFIQTLFYGVFSAWVLWTREGGQGSFDWRVAEWSLRVPMVRVLFEELSRASRLAPLNLVEVLEWATRALNRVDLERFFQRFEQDLVVAHFYEPFLREFDPQLRDELGVWYTPPEIVTYMVERADRVLRDHLRMPDGFADPRVIVLDPAAGTGSFLLEVLKRIEKTLIERGGDALIGEDLQRAATERTFGFELLPAPFVVAHLRLGLYLQEFGVALQDEHANRLGVFLTNSLTGWGPEPPPPLPFPEFADERDAARRIKVGERVLVVIGNPPYNAFAGVSEQAEGDLMEPYLSRLSAWGVTKHSLNDLYVRFFRVAERSIAEQTGHGIVCYISNRSWLDDPSYVTLREHMLMSFDRFWIDNLHGDREGSETGPDGTASQTVFSMPGISSGIRKGVAISLWMRDEGHESKQADVLFRNDINASDAAQRRRQLLDSLDDDPADVYVEATPTKSNRLAFWPHVVHEHFWQWPALPDLAEVVPMLGLNENRHGDLMDISRDALEERMHAYYSRDVSWEQLMNVAPGLTRKAARYEPKLVRARALRQESFDPAKIRRFLFRPLDERWAYVSGVTKLWNEARSDLQKVSKRIERFVVARNHAPRYNDGAAMMAAASLADQHAMHKDASGVSI